MIRDGLWKDITYGGDEPELAIGYRFRDNGFKGGRVDELKIFDRALTSMEVAHSRAAMTSRTVQHRGGQALASAAWTVVRTFLRHEIRTRAQGCRGTFRARATSSGSSSIPFRKSWPCRKCRSPSPRIILKRGAYDAPGERVFANTPHGFRRFRRTSRRIGSASRSGCCKPDTRSWRASR